MNDETSPAYHSGMRALQDRFDTRRLADRLEEKLARRDFSDEDRAFIESRSLFFLSTADADGQPDCSYKGGACRNGPAALACRCGTPGMFRRSWRYSFEKTTGCAGFALTCSWNRSGRA